MINKLRCLSKEQEVYHYSNCLPVFGHGHFLYLEGNSSGSSYANSNAYELPPHVDDPNSYLAGARMFMVSEVEVYSVETDMTQVQSVLGASYQGQQENVQRRSQAYQDSKNNAPQQPQGQFRPPVHDGAATSQPPRE